MAGLHFEPLSGVVDGINAVFTTSTAYSPGTVAVYLNGQLILHPLGNSWLETDPTLGIITFEPGFIPVAGDVVAAAWCDTAPDLIETEVTPIEGTIEEADSLTGMLSAELSVGGTLEVDDAVVGSLQAEASLAGALGEVDFLEGELEICEG